MTSFSFILSSARFYARAHMGLLLGAFLASAILSGSLLVGDSVKASLRRVAELRLGKVQVGMIGGDRWFTEDLANKVGGAPLIIANGSVSAATGAARVNAVQVLGAGEDFWKLSASGKAVSIGKDEVAVNEPLARKLNIKVGDTIVVRLEKPSAISRDAPLSGSTNQDIALRRTVSSVVSAEDFSAFQLTASQVSPDTVFVGLPDLENQLEMQGKVNAMVGASAVDAAKLEAGKTLADFALKIAKAPGSKAEWDISTDRVFLDDSLSDKLLKKLPGSYGVLTYLVNSIESKGGKTPQSMVAAVDRMAAPGTMTINQWLADDQGLKVGDKVEAKYFVVGIGREMKEQTASFTVGRIVGMNDPDVNREWTPHFPGVSDVANCRDWDPGIPMDKKAIRDKDEKYWTDFKTTPKAFISLADGQKLWSNRFGKLTGIRLADTGQKLEDLQREIAGLLSLSDIGLAVRDFKTEAGAAAQGSVDFGGLFVGLSMFLIAAALVFAGLLFVFMIELRASQVGLLMALGWTQKQVRRALLSEAGVIALLGSLLGLLGGVVYTKVALAGLNGVWGGATVGLKLMFAAKPETLVIALVSSFVVSLVTLWFASRRLFKTAPRALLAGEGMQAVSKKKAARWRNWKVVAVVSLIGAAGLSFAGTKATNAEELGGMFFGAGTMLMFAGLALASGWMKAQGRGQRLARSLGQIGLRNVVRRPGRSLAVLGMMAGGIFLVAAVNAFRLSAGTDPTVRDSGTGGFVLMGESSLPIYEDLNTKTGRETFGLDADDMKGVAVVPFRVRPGDDASCLNLNKAQNPQLVAVNAAALDSRKAFGFASPAAASWSLLDQTDADGAVPAIADMNTAMWGLGMGVGDTLIYKDAAGAEFKVKLVALLAGSVLQGKVIISEKNFLAKLPDAAGYRFFLLDAPAARAKEVSKDLTKQLEQRGLALEPAQDRFDAFSAVQNTYIGIFTVLGGLGVLLGTAGIGVLVARHVMERRGELGLMQALGFKPSALLRMIVGEHGSLLLAGVVLGVVSAGLAVWPTLHQSSHDLPLGFMVGLVLAIIVCGLLVCTAAASMALRGRLLDAVRKE
ncbi:MAG: FtsX-like permease family protein [Verrucomicrobiaceae bacterium]|nr:FtsX-like permease family protein [Verrucomicrobiaceae bacterium]